jgi:hypothetical protein
MSSSDDDEDAGWGRRRGRRRADDDDDGAGDSDDDDGGGRAGLGGGGVGRRRKRGGGDEDAMLGVFAEDSDDGSEGKGRQADRRGPGGRGGGRGGREAASARLLRPMSFVGVASTRDDDEADGGRGAAGAHPRKRTRGGDDDDAGGAGVARRAGLGARGEGGSDDDDDDDGGRGGLGLGLGLGAGPRGPRPRSDSDVDDEPRGRRRQVDEDDEAEVEEERPRLGLGRRRDDDDDEEEESAPRAGLGGGGGGGGAGGGLSNDMFRQLLSSVNANVAPAAAPAPAPAPVPAAASSSSSYGEGSRVRGLGFFAQRPVDAGAPSSSSSSTAGAPPAAPVPGLGGFEKFTKGFGAKYLSKFNFKGRLGKNEQGIVVPVAVQVRPNQLGLGFGGFKEANKLAANREIERDRKGEADGSDDGDGDGGKTGSVAAAAAAAGRAAAGIPGVARPPAAKRVAKPKKVYKTAAELLAADEAASFGGAAGAAGSSAGLVIDMRGPKARVLQGMDGIGAAADEPEEDAARSAGGPPRLGAELLHNLSILVDLSEGDLVAAHRKVRTGTAKLEGLQREAAALAAEVDSAGARADALEALLAEVRACTERVTTALAEADLLLLRAAAAGPGPAVAAAAAAKRPAGPARIIDVDEEEDNARGPGSGSGPSSWALLPSARASSSPVPIPAEAAAHILEAAAESFERMRELHPDAFGEHRGVSVGPALVHLVLARLCGAWGWEPPLADDAVQPAAGTTPPTAGDLTDMRVRDVPTVLLLSALRRWARLLSLPVPAPSAPDEEDEDDSDDDGVGGGGAGGGSSRLFGRPRFLDEDAGAQQRRRARRDAARLAREQRAADSETARAHFLAVVDATLLARVRAGLASPTWRVKAPRPALALLLALAPAAAFPGDGLGGGGGGGPPRGAASDLVPLPAFRAVVDACVLPRLVQAVDAWDPRTDPVPVQDWTLPWAAPALLGAEVPAARLWPPIRHKLQTALAAWHPADASARTILAPWRAVWDAKAFDALVARSILPKLVGVLRELRVGVVGGGVEGGTSASSSSAAAAAAPDPAVEPFGWVMEWTDLLPAGHASALVEGELLPKLVAALADALRLRGPAGGGDDDDDAPPDYDAVADTYVAWKGRLPKAVASSSGVQGVLSRALDLMNLALEAFEGAGAGGDGGGASEDDGGLAARLAAARRSASVILDVVGSPASQSYARVLESRRIASTSAAATAAAVAAVAAAAAAPSAKHKAPAPAASAAARAGLGGATAADAAVSFRDFVEVTLANEGLTFLPNTRRAPVDGCPVFRVSSSGAGAGVGAVNVYIQQGVVFAEAAGAFRPVSLDAVVGMVKGVGGGGR